MSCDNRHKDNTIYEIVYGVHEDDASIPEDLAEPVEEDSPSLYQGKDYTKMTRKEFLKELEKKFGKQSV